VPSSDAFIVTEPSGKTDLDIYYTLRFDVLRKPWGQPKGSEVDETDASSIHAFIKVNNKAVAVSRLHFIDEDTGQVRYMGVHPAYQGKGLGKMVLEYLEKKCLENGRQTMILHARETAIKFYERCGYKVKERSYLMWGEIQHYLMEKKLRA
jgi:ribosomal protein S18 acetylase RimI-like enzyme